MSGVVTISAVMAAIATQTVAVIKADDAFVLILLRFDSKKPHSTVPVKLIALGHYNLISKYWIVGAKNRNFLDMTTEARKRRNPAAR